MKNVLLVEGEEKHEANELLGVFEDSKQGYVDAVVLAVAQARKAYGAGGRRFDDVRICRVNAGAKLKDRETLAIF